MYTHTKQIIQMTATGIDISSSGVIGLRFTPGLVPYIIRGFSMTNTSTLANCSGLVAVLQNRALSDTTATAIATLNGTATNGAGVVIYKNGLNKRVDPGQEVSVDISSAATVAALMSFVMMVEPQWETPVNISGMKATT